MSLFSWSKKRQNRTSKPEHDKSADIDRPLAPTPAPAPVSLFTRKARGTVIPKKTQRLFLCCDEANTGFRDVLCADLLSHDAGADCVVTYLNRAPDAEDDLLGELVESQAVVLAVTSALLDAMEAGSAPAAYTLARQNDVPILPVATDGRLFPRFTALAGAVHGIAATDPEYRDKLRGQIDHLLVTADLFAHIKEHAFSAGLFLSYRKKDLIEARRFMRRFHAIPGFEPVAIWYDNFLTAGRFFDDEIRDSIANSDAFVLLVTPHLTEAGNYVLTEEYPYAKNEAQKSVLAIEAVPTDRTSFAACYPGVDRYADMDGQEEIFRATLPPDAFPSKLNSERLLWLGMAYLKGTLVERDTDHAVSLLDTAAQGADESSLHAAEQLADLYEFGLGKPVDYDRALLFRSRCVALCTALYGHEWPKTAAAYNNVGQVYEKLGRYTEALKAYRTDIEISLKTVGEEHPDTAVTYSNIGELMRKMGDQDAAIDMAHKALDIRVRTLGADNPAVASSYNNMAVAYKDKGQLDKALEMYKRAAALRENTVGAENTETAIVYSNIASVLTEMEKYSEAFSYSEKAVRVMEKLLGDAHYSTAIAYKIMSGIYEGLGQYDRAYTYAFKALHIAQKTLGEHHRDLAPFSLDAADLKNKLGAFNEAAALYRRTLETLDACENPSENLRVQTLANNAKNIQDAGDYPRALQAYRDALKRALETMGEEHPDVGSIYNSMGVLYRLMGDNEAALDMYRKALPIREKACGENSKPVSTTLNNMALVYQLTGRHDMALTAYQRSLEIDKGIFGEMHPDTATTYSNIALLLLAMGDLAKAEDAARTALRSLEACLGTEHPSTAVAQHTMAMVLHKRGENAEALRCCLQAFKIWERTLPPDHPNLNTAFNHLGIIYTSMGHSKEEFFVWADQNGLLI